jgi:tetratricopeptide (TPR) repeat protein
VEQRWKGKPEQLRYLWARSGILAGLGRKEEAIRDGRRALEMSPPRGIPYLAQIQKLARIYTMVGEYNQAFDQLEIILSNALSLNINVVRCRPVYRSLLAHPRFKALEKKYPPDKPYAGP